MDERMTPIPELVQRAELLIEALPISVPSRARPS